MKTVFYISVLSIFLLFGVSSCKKDDNSSVNSSGINATIQQGKWRITSFTDKGNDETNHYTGYTFQFNSNGTVVAFNSGITVNGTWSDGNDDSQLKLVLNFGTNIPFEEMNEDWHVLQQNGSLIKLEDVSGGNGGTKYLTFEKI